MASLAKGACAWEDLNTLRNFTGIGEHERICALILRPALSCRALLIISISKLLSGLTESGHHRVPLRAGPASGGTAPLAGGAEAESFMENATMLVEGEYACPARWALDDGA
jgi:hypothetical protein